MSASPRTFDELVSRLDVACGVEASNYSQCDEERIEVEFLIKWSRAAGVRRELLDMGALLEVDTLGAVSGVLDGFPVFIACEVPIREAMRLLAVRMVAIESEVPGGLTALIAGEHPVPDDLNTDKVWETVDEDDPLSGTPDAWLIGVLDQELSRRPFGSNVVVDSVCETVATLLLDVVTAQGLGADEPYWWDAVQFVTSALSDPGFTPVRTAKALEASTRKVARRRDGTPAVRTTG